MSACYEICECDPTGSMKQRLAERHISEHIAAAKPAASKRDQELDLALTPWAQFELQG